MKERLDRETAETRVTVALDLAGGLVRVDTGVEFFDHLLAAMAHHARWGLDIKARGDVGAGGHHLVEDVGLVLGQALSQAWGDRATMERLGHALVPVDEALALAAVDLGGRPCLALDFALPHRSWGAWETDLWPVFLQALVSRAAITLHLRALAGSNPHCLLEAGAQALGVALDRAAARTGRFSAGEEGETPRGPGGRRPGAAEADPGGGA